MSALSDQIDRLSRHTKVITATAAKTALTGDGARAGPFTEAVLNTSLGDLIRDVDPSELGLFELVTPSNPNAHGGGDATPEISRVKFTGATPLRKPPLQRGGNQKPEEVDPEVYARAALKCIDQYEPIRPMPRARSQAQAIIEQLVDVRENMRTLSESLSQIKSADAPSLKSLTEEEEGHIQELQSRISDLKKRKDAASSRKGVRKPAGSNKTAAPRTKINNPSTPVASSSDLSQENAFWTTPATAARVLRFTDNLLMDEQVDLGDVSTTSFASPTPPPSNWNKHVAEPSPAKSPHSEDHSPAPGIHATTGENQIDEPHDESIQDDGDDVDDEADEDEKTVVLKKTVTPSPPHIPKSLIETKPPTQTSPRSSHKPRVKVNNEIERIVAKLWTTVGDTVMPGHPFDTSGSSGGSHKPPLAKETIAHLQTMSTLTASPNSPSASSASSLSAAVPAQPTAQQILTAHLLFLLLTSPSLSMPLNKLKDALAAKAGSSNQTTTRALYGCVAKRLVKIDRGGGEQVVKFDI